MFKKPLFEWIPTKADRVAQIEKIGHPYIEGFINFIFSKRFLTTFPIICFLLILPFARYLSFVSEDYKTYLPNANYGYAVALFFGLLIIFIFYVSYLYAIYKCNQLKRDAKIHLVFHRLRDLYFKVRSIRKNDDKCIAYAIGATELIAEFFRETFCDKGFGCCIRIANVLPSEDGQHFETLYATMGRSQNVQGSRRNESQIKSHEGIAAALLSKIRDRSIHAILIRNIKRMIVERPDLWKETINDGGDEIQSVLICPINCRENDKIKMIGMLYLTSHEIESSTKISHDQVEMLCAFADSLASEFTQFIGNKYQNIVEADG